MRLTFSCSVKGTSRRATTAKKAREEQIKNYNDRCAAEDAAEKNVAQETAAEENADEEGTDVSVSDEETDDDAADNQDRAVPTSSPNRRPVRFPETTRDATHENTAAKQSFLKTVKKMGSIIPGRHRDRQNGQRSNGIQFRSLFKKKHTGPPMEYYM